jgi:xylulokinase
MQLVDVASAQWSPQLCDLAGITPDQLAQLKPAGTIIGPVTPSASRLTGLPPTTLVVNGGHDHSCAALAMGMISADEVMLSTGTAWVITGVVETPSIDAIPDRMDLNFHVAPQRWTISQFLGGFGASVAWCLQQCWPADDAGETLLGEQRYAEFDKTIAKSRPGCDGLFFLPMEGNSQLPGGNSQGGFVGLHLGHTRMDMSRAILEGAAYELRWALDTMRLSGLPVERLWLAGGATRSPVWPQILADVCGLPISSSLYTHWPALGAAILAGVGAGIFETLEVGIDRLRKLPREILPDETQSSIYHDSFSRYQSVSQKLWQ